MEVFAIKKHNISNNVIRRMPRYLRKLEDLMRHDVERISSGELGRQMGLTPSQIRQDFSCFGEFGQQGYGYNVKALHREISNILGIDSHYSAVLIGVGHLGHALIANFPFSKFGFRFLGAFDIDKSLVGTAVGNYLVMDAEDQADFIRDNAVDIAILAVPKPEAQHVADRIIRCGIRAIWNFTDVELDPGQSGVIIENIHFSDSLLTLSYYLSSESEP